MNSKDSMTVGFIAGAALIGGLACLYNKVKNSKSTLSVDYKGDVTDIHLTGSQCSKNYIKKRLPEEINIARKIQEQNFDLHPDGCTIILE